MSVFSLTWHSLKFVFDNPRVAVWTFLPAFVVNVVWQPLMTAHYRYHAFHFFDAGSSRFPGFALTPYLPFLIGIFVLSIAVQLVIAVAWHRYVLTGERPWSRGIFPGRREWRYFLRVLLIGLVLAGLFLVASVLISILVVVLKRSGGGPVTGVLVFFAFFGMALSSLTYIGLRFSLGLPAASVDGPKLGLRASWRLTRQYRKDIFGLTCALVAVATLVGVFFAFGSDARMIYSYAWTLIGTMINMPFTFIIWPAVFTAITFVYREATKATGTDAASP